MKELNIFIGMSRVLNKINRETGRVHAKYGLTSAQFAVLEALYHKGDLCVGDVQKKILSTTGTIPVIVKNLERDGYLVKKVDEIDKRKNILHITEKGIKKIEEVYPENEKIIISILNVLKENEKRELIKLLKIIGGYDNEKRN